jgi:hypothetical protein
MADQRQVVSITVERPEPPPVTPQQVIPLSALNSHPLDILQRFFLSHGFILMLTIISPLVALCGPCGVSTGRRCSGGSSSRIGRNHTPTGGETPCPSSPRTLFLFLCLCLFFLSFLGQRQASVN